MKAQKDQTTGKWFIQYRYTDWQGNRKKSTKRGFKTKREGEEWLRNFLLMKQGDFNMKFADFVQLYYEDIEDRLRLHTIKTKKYIIDLKILPYFGHLSISEIKPADIRKWQNELIKKGYSATYLRTIQNQIRAVLNYAVKYYDLKNNPCAKAGSMGRNKADSASFWTKQEFEKFVEAIIDKRMSYMAFEVLFWTGARISELLALTPKDIDFEKRTISISRAYQRIDGRDIITPPKTPRSKRVINIPEFLAIDLQDYVGSFYGIRADDRLFPVTKGYLTSEMKRGTKISGVKKIKLHSIRHSHASFLIEMGCFTPLVIAERLGHSVDTLLSTYAHLYPDKQNQIADKLEAEHKEGL